MATTSVEIVVPDGCSAGMDFTVEWGGTSYNITVPDGVTAGQLLTIELPALQEETHPTGGMQPVEIVVPDGCTPGMEFTVEWGGRFLHDRCARGRLAGSAAYDRAAGAAGRARAEHPGGGGRFCARSGW